MTLPPSTPLVATLGAIEARLSELTVAMQQQNMLLGRIDDRLAELAQRSEWNDVQAAQMLRVIATAVRQVRETQVYGLLSEGPVTTQALRELLQSTNDPLIIARRPGAPPQPPFWED